MKQIRNIVNYFELSEEWQEEARRNLDELAESVSYLEPLEGQSPDKHILYDLSECMRVEGKDYDGVISISNNCALTVKLLDDGTAEIERV